MCDTYVGADPSAKLPRYSDSLASCSPLDRIDTNELPREISRWTELPCELVSSIASQLGIVDLLSFRGVCKHWNSASFPASAQVESSSRREPWFLIYGEGSQCRLLSEPGKEYTINIPELDGAACLGSNTGWLLLLREGSMYFFCPFSRARISLPEFPRLEFINCLASFSSPPTSTDCTVAVVCQNDSSEVELFILNRGDVAWTKHEYAKKDFKKVVCGTYHPGDKCFYFVDDDKGLITFSTVRKDFTKYNIIWRPTENSKSEELPFYMRRGYFKERNMRQRLNLGEDVTISTCGTAVSIDGTNKIIFNECIKALVGSESNNIVPNESTNPPPEGSKSRSLNGIWIHPRFMQVQPDQS
ncbi:hypothetical protein Tsubulata_040088, partial [Turnera subulata]